MEEKINVLDLEIKFQQIHENIEKEFFEESLKLGAARYLNDPKVFASNT